MKSIKKKPLDIFQITFFISLTFSIIVILFVFLESFHLPPVVPLYYGKPAGEEQLAKKSFLALPALVSSLFAFLSFAMIRITKDVFIKYILMGTMVTITLLSTIAIVKIFFLIASL